MPRRFVVARGAAIVYDRGFTGSLGSTRRIFGRSVYQHRPAFFLPMPNAGTVGLKYYFGSSACQTAVLLTIIRIMPAVTTKPLMADNGGMPLDLDKVRTLRAQLGITMDEAASRAGLAGKQSWSLIESGKKSDVRVSTLEAIARALGVRARDLLKD